MAGFHKPPERYLTESKRFFDRMASRKHGNSAILHREVLRDHPPLPGDLILDLGCGRGEFLSMLRERPHGLLFGLDLSENMVSLSRRAAPDAEVFSGDAAAIPLASSSLHRVYSFNSFHHYPFPARVAEEIYRVLKPGGTVIIGEVFLPPILREFINLLLPLGWTGDHTMYSRRSLAAVFTSAGFHTLSYRKLPGATFYMVFKKSQD